MNHSQNEFIVKLTKTIFSEDDYRKVFDLIFQELNIFVPYDRIALALLKHEWLMVKIVKTTYPEIALVQGEKVLLKNTSLQKIARSGKIRIINDYQDYFSQHPKPLSATNQHLLKEGIRSSLTVPLNIKDQTIGMMFFSSRQPHAYAPKDVKFLEEIAELMAIAIQKNILIFDLKNSCELLTKANSELIKANQLNDEILSIAAHDIKNLIHPIKFTVEMLLRQPELTQHTKWINYLTNIKEVSLQLNGLVLNILDTSRIKHGKATLEKNRFSPHKVLNNVMVSWALQASRKHITLSLQLSSNFPKDITGDEVKFAQIFNNLISNAIKFTGDNGTVVLTEKKEKEFYKFTVKDSGLGIPPAKLQSLFNQFETSQGTRGERGTGFGLNIVREVVRLHKGKIEVSSKLGRGTKFTVYLPILA